MQHRFSLFSLARRRRRRCHTKHPSPFYAQVLIFHLKPCANTTRARPWRRRPCRRRFFLFYFLAGAERASERRRRLDIRIFQSLQRYNPGWLHGWRPFYEYHEVQNDWLADAESEAAQPQRGLILNFFVVEWRKGLYINACMWRQGFLALHHLALTMCARGSKRTPLKLKAARVPL